MNDTIVRMAALLFAADQLDQLCGQDVDVVQSVLLDSGKGNTPLFEALQQIRFDRT